MSKELQRIWQTIPSDGQFMALFGDVSKKMLGIYHAIDQGTVYKQDNSPQTLADRLSDEMICRYLKTNTPYPILSEESETDDSVLSSEFFWIVDPLDGTKDFIGKTGEFSIMAGLVKDQIPIFGAVYHPLSGKCYLARKESGALLLGNDGSSVLLHVSNIAEARDMRMVISRTFTKGTDLEVARRLGIQEPNLRLHGSFGLKACRIVDGTADIFLSSSNKTSIWDSIPNIPIVLEAGGNITDLNGDALLANPANRRNEKGIIVTNGQNHHVLASRIRDIVSQLRQ